MVPIQLTVTGDWYQYQVLAGTNNLNYFLIVFNGPHPLDKSNIDHIDFVGLSYVTNSKYYSFDDNDCDINITIDKNNLLTGTFNALRTIQPNDQQQALSGMFKNILLR